MSKPNCYKCNFRGTVPGDCHSSCRALGAIVKGNPYGIANGWFLWPFNFDPTWLESCDSFSDDEREATP